MPRVRDRIDQRSTRSAAGSGLHGATPGVAATWSKTVSVDGREVLRLTAAATRVHVHLVMPGIGRSVEVTGAPATAAHALDDAAARAGVNPSRVHADAHRALTEAAEHAGAWLPTGDAPLVTWFGGASYPLLAAAYAAHAAPIDTVPRWADAILAAPDVRSGARTAFGSGATRPVVAALARSLVRVPDAPVDLSRLALALIGRDVLEPDHLVTVLDAPGPPWPHTALPSPRLLEQARSVTLRWGAERTIGYLTQAAAERRSRHCFTDCVAHATDLQWHAPLHLPADLDDLRTLYRLQIRTADDAPTRSVAPQGPSTLNSTTSPDSVCYGALRAPLVDARSPVTDATPIPHPRWLVGVDGSTAGDFTFVLPRTCGDLIRWARAMSNCLHTFRVAAAERASNLVGVTVGGRLRYVLEIDPERAIRQFAGPANRPVDQADHDAIIGHLRARRVLAR